MSRNVAFGAGPPNIDIDNSGLSAFAIAQPIKFEPGETNTLAKVIAITKAPAELSSDRSKAILHDLPDVWQVQDQGETRGTCNAFAMASAEELHRFWHQGVNPADQRFSEEHLYTSMRNVLIKDRDDIPGYHSQGATILAQAGEAMHLSACVDDVMTYDPRKTPPSYTEPLTQAAVADARNRKLNNLSFWNILIKPGIDPRPTNLVDTILYLLEQKRPVLVSLPVFTAGNWSNWTSNWAWRSGMIVDPAPSESANTNAPGHTVCIVGYNSSKDGRGKGWFIFRNSWGIRFRSDPRPDLDPIDGIPDKGYGVVSTDYVEKHAFDLLFHKFELP